MNDQHGSGGFDRRTAERILDGARDHARLHALLSAAAAPARPEELTGEDAAVAAFRAAPSPSRTSRFEVLRRFLTVKALVLIGGSLIITGGAAAYAAMNGHLPGRAPAPTPTPKQEQTNSDRQHRMSVTEITPPSERQPSSSAAPGGPESTQSGPAHQQPETPGKQPPGGAGDDHGSPPGQNSGNGSPPGQNSGDGSPPGRDSGNGSPPGQNSGNGSPPGQNSGNGSPPGQNSGNGSPPGQNSGNGSPPGQNSGNGNDPS